MASYSADCYREKMLQWKHDVFSIYAEVRNGGAEAATAETLGRIEDTRSVLAELATEACTQSHTWAVRPRSFADAYFITLRYAKKKYDYICRLADEKSAPVAEAADAI